MTQQTRRNTLVRTLRLTRAVLLCFTCAASLVSPASLVTASTSVAALAPLMKSRQTSQPELLGAYRADQTGGFSHRWLAYILEPKEGATDKNYYVEINGKRLGPYTSISQRFVISRDGEHIAFAAEKKGKWVIVVDGEERWQHDNVGWATYAWTSSLEGRSFIPESSAAVLVFSPQGDQLAYLVTTGEEQWAIAVNGKPGQTFSPVSVAVQFVNGKVAYWGKSPEGTVYVHGDKTLGPYDEVWTTKFSADDNHFAFGAKRGEMHFLIVDGEERALDGVLSNYELGLNGELVYAVKNGNDHRVYFGNRAIEGVYDDVARMTISPDGKHVAFWGKQGQRWSLVTDIAVYPGYDGYWFYDSGGEEYSIFWDAKSSAPSFLARDGKEIVLSLKGKRQAAPSFPGLAFTNYVDDEGTRVGMGFMGGASLDRQAFIECLTRQARSKCDPFTAALVGGQLAYVETAQGRSTVVIGNKREGPYQEVVSSVIAEDNGSNYVYVIKTPKGVQVVLNGQPMDAIYDAIYRITPVGDTGVGFLGVRGDKVYSQFFPWPTK